MSITVYVDTNVFIDFLERRNRKVFSFFMRTISCEFSLFISDVVLFELEKSGYSFVALQKWFDKKITILQSTANDKKQALSIQTHYADALHVAVAKRVKADLFLSQDKGFSFLTNWRTIDEI